MFISFTCKLKSRVKGQPMAWKQVSCPLNRRKTWICTVFFLHFPSVSLRSGLQRVCLNSTKQHLTEEDIYKPSASVAIKHDWYPECPVIIVCVLKAIGRSQDFYLSRSRSLGKGGICPGKKFDVGEVCFWSLHSENKEPPSASIKEVNITHRGKRTKK